jgi:uncharacterized membrane protein YccC
MHERQVDNMPKSSKPKDSCTVDLFEGLGTYRAALAVLTRAADANRELNPGELLELSSSMGWNQHHAQRQLKRLQKHRQLRLVAGTDADRQAASKAVDDSLRIRSVRGAEIESKIVELQKELNRLDDDIARAERRVNEMDAAKEQCRTVLPDDLFKLLSKQRAAVKSKLFPKVAEIETALNECRAMLAVDGRDSNRVSLLPPKFWANDPISRKPILKPAFFVYQLECQAKIPELELQLSEAQQALDAALQAFDSSLDCLTL